MLDSHICSLKKNASILVLFSIQPSPGRRRLRMKSTLLFLLQRQTKSLKLYVLCEPPDKRIQEKIAFSHRLLTSLIRVASPIASGVRTLKVKTTIFQL